MATDETTTKRCPKCGLSKPLDSFPRCKGRKDGRAGHCRECRNAAERTRWKAKPLDAKQEHFARNRAWRAANPASARKHVRDYQKRNPEKTKANCRRWLENNRDYANARARSYYHANPEKYRALMAIWQRRNAPRQREYRREYRAANPELHAQLSRNYKARKRGAEGAHTAADVAAIFKAQKGRCAYCRKHLGKKHHVDHIRPLSKGGTNNPSNLQITCAFCNISKKNKDPLVFAKQMGRLL